MVNLYAIICPEIRNRIEIPHMCGSININSSLEIRIQANEKEIAMRILDDFINFLIIRFFCLFIFIHHLTLVDFKSTRMVFESTYI